MDQCYPIVTIKRKSTEDPWITDKIRWKIRKRKAIFKKEGRSKAWKKIKKICVRMIKYHREKYLESHKLLLTSPDSASRFFRRL